MFTSFESINLLEFLDYLYIKGVNYRITNRLNYISEIRLFQYSETDSKMSSPPSSLERSQSSNDDWMYSSDSLSRYGSEDDLIQMTPSGSSLMIRNTAMKRKKLKRTIAVKRRKRRKVIRKTNTVII